MNSTSSHWLSQVKPAYLFVLFMFAGVVFVLAPVAVIVPAAVFFYLSNGTKCEGCVLAAWAWMLYGVWEYGMYTKTLCSGECNIRIDLIVAWIILAKISSKAIHGYISSRNA